MARVRSRPIRFRGVSAACNGKAQSYPAGGKLERPAYRSIVGASLIPRPPPDRPFGNLPARHSNARTPTNRRSTKGTALAVGADLAPARMIEIGWHASRTALFVSRTESSDPAASSGKSCKLRLRRCCRPPPLLACARTSADIATGDLTVASPASCRCNRHCGRGSSLCAGLSRNMMRTPFRASSSSPPALITQAGFAPIAPVLTRGGTRG